MTKAASNWVVVPKSNPRARLRLFCFPYGGAGASIYRAWPNGLLPDVELCAVQLPGRENRFAEPPFTSVSALAETLADELQPLLDKPFALFGHSLGAFIGFELAHKLRGQSAHNLVHLFVSGQRAPHRPDPLEPIYQLEDRLFLNEICVRYDAIPASVLQSEAMMRLVLPLLRADYTMNDTYTCTNTSPLACPISCFGGEQDVETTYQDLAAWAAHTKNVFQLKMFAGGHFFIKNEQTSLLQTLTDSLRAHVPICA